MGFQSLVIQQKNWNPIFEMHKKVVSNTTPLISLMKIGKLDFLKDLFGEVWIPNEVFEEIQKGMDKEFYEDPSKIEWIKIKKVKDKKSLSYFIDLDKGDAETIALAVENDADLVIIDEILGRYYAKHAGLKITGTIGLLIKAKQKGLVQQIKPMIAQLKEKGIWLSDSLVQQALKLSNEAE